MGDVLEHLTYRKAGAFWLFSDGTRLPVVAGGDGPTPVEQLVADLRAGTVAADGLAERLAALSDAERVEFETALVALFDALVDGTAEVEDGADRLEVLESLANAIDATRTDGTRRETEATEAQARADALRERVHPTAEDGGGDDGEGGEAPAETPPADDTPAPVEGEAAPVPVAAAAPPRITRVAVRGLPNARPPAAVATPATVITAAAEVPGYAAGQPLPDFDALVAALSSRAESIRRVSVGEGSAISYHVATIAADYPAERDLRRVQHDPRSVDAVVAGAIGPNSERLLEPITAAGGFCAPAPPLYEQIAISEDARPVRTALPSFQAGRGRVQFMPSPVWTDYTAGVRVWTGTNDTEALSNSNVRKPCVRVDCDSMTTAEVYAIPVCVTVGNFFDRTYPERRDAILSGVMAWQARFAERELLEAIKNASTTVTTGQTLGTTRDVLALLDRYIAGFASRWRVGDAFRLELLAPRWLRNMMRADLVRSLPVSGASMAENLAVSDAMLEGFLAARGLNVTWIWDGERGGTTQEFGAEAGGSLQNWPTNVVMYLFHPGAHRFLDGGELQIGVQRDSTLNATNDLQIWGETFEGLMSPGLESIRIDADVCPSGEISGTVDVTGALCTTGS